MMLSIIMIYDDWTCEAEIWIDNELMDYMSSFYYSWPKKYINVDGMIV